MCWRHLGKSVRLKAYQCTVKCVKCSWVFGGFLLMVFFCLEKISVNAIFRTFPCLENAIFRTFSCAKTTYKLLWNSRNVRNIIKAVNVRMYLDLIGKFVLVGKMTFFSMHPWSHRNFSKCCKTAVSGKFGHCSSHASLKIWWIIMDEH